MNEPADRYSWILVLLLLLSAGSGPLVATEMIESSGVSGGLVVHVGCGDGRLTLQLRASEGFLVQGLDTDAARVGKTRRHFHSLGTSGKVTVDTFDGKRLPYADNLVNLLVVSRRYEVSSREMLRVLAPRGVALISAAGSQGVDLGGERVEIDGASWRKIVKPWPEGMDEWTHYLHGPDNNAVAHDSVVGPPRQMQWLAGPEWARNHHRLCSISTVVTAEGRLFTIQDEATSANMGVPGKWSLVARDAFSGVTLWQKPIQTWAWHQIRFRSGPPQVTRLLVASGDRLFVPLGLGEPISAVDAVTGETLRSFEGTAGAEEIILTGETLLVLKGVPVAAQAVGHPAFKELYKKPNEKTLVALDAQTGKTLWTWSDSEVVVRPETLGSDGKRVYLQVDEGVACLDLASGDALWTYTEPVQEKKKQPPRKKGAKRPVTYGTNVLVVSDDVVLSKLAGKLTALSAETGEKLWQCPAGSGFHAPLDVFVIDGLVWKGDHISDSVAPPPVGDFNEGRDLHTGEVRKTSAVAVDLQTAGHHHRCYREKATDRFIITGKRGIEMMDLAGSDHSRNNWIRGACQYGILPANGLLYAPSHACGCYMESKLRGFWALAPKGRENGEGGSETGRLERGRAYGKAGTSAPRGPQDWPMYRHDPLRSGVAGTVVSPELKQAWKAGIGGRLTQPVVAGGKVLVASVERSAVYALDEETGAVAWKHVAGARVDSPPAIHEGMALFGSADGRVTCLRLSDGELIWRFLAAPADQRTVVFDQVESLWPVHGSVLLLDGVAYCSAGRSTWLDGGIHLYALDPATGNVLHQTRFQSKHPEFEEGKDAARPEHETRIDQNTTDYKTFLAPDRSDSFSMAGGTVSDVLTSDGKNVFLHQVKFNAGLERQEEMSRHLFSTSSLLDAAENHRSHWVLGTGDFSRVGVAYSWVVNRPGKRMPTIAVPTGVMMVFDEEALWGVRRQGDANGRYHLFKKENRPFSEDEEFLPDFRKISPEEAVAAVWKNDFPVRTTAMLKSGDHLFIGVTPVDVPEQDPHTAYEGRAGGSVWVCAQGDGAKVGEHRLESPVAWDAMAAAAGKLFLATADGSVVCLQ